MPSKFISGALTTAAVVAFMAAAAPAFACKGSQTLLRDDFTDEDPAWNIQDNNAAQIGGGVLKLRSEPGKNFWLLYGGQNFPEADVCFDLIAPGGKPSSDNFAGLAFWGGGKWNIVEIATDGTVGVQGNNRTGWTVPVPPRKFDAVKTGPNAVNSVRVTWKAPPDSNAKTAPDPTVTIFINDKQFIKFKVVPNADRNIGFYTQSDGGTYQIKNLVVTD